MYGGASVNALIAIGIIVLVCGFINNIKMPEEMVEEINDLWPPRRFVLICIAAAGVYLLQYVKVIEPFLMTRF